MRVGLAHTDAWAWPIVVAEQLRSASAERPLTDRVLISEFAEDSIIVSPAVFDALHEAGLLRQVFGSWPDEWPTFGYDYFESVRCWLIEGQRIFEVGQK